MRTARELSLVAILIGLFAVVSVEAQNFSDGYDPSTPEWRGQSGMTWLQVGGSARAEGMGGSAAGIAMDPMAAFYNPAGVAGVKGVVVGASQTNWLADMSVNHFAVMAEAGILTFGATYASMDYGLIVGTVIADPATEPGAINGYLRTGSLQPEVYSAGIVIAAKLTDRFSVGGQIKTCVQDFGASTVYISNASVPWRPFANDNRVAASAIDIGTQYDTGMWNIKLNMAFQNFAAAQSYVEQEFDLPLTYRVGISGDLIEVITGMASPFHQLNWYVDGVDRRDVRIDFAAGAEYVIEVPPGIKLALRAGRRAARYQEGWLSLGGGVAVPYEGMQLGVDWSYNDYGADFDPVQQFGLRFDVDL